MEATLVIIGLNFRTAAVAVRERFWMNAERRADALQQLVRSEGIDEIVILGTCNRTEFIFWASDPAEGANSVLRFLTREFNLKLSEWSNFYRLMDDNALLHLFEDAAGLDSLVPGEAEITRHLQDAWELSQRTGTVGRILDVIMQKTFSAARRARTESGLTQVTNSLVNAIVTVGKAKLDTLTGRKIVLVGAGKMGELTACNLVSAGATNLTIINRDAEKARALAQQLGATASAFELRAEEIMDADLVITATTSKDPIFTAEQISNAAGTRNRTPLTLIDVSVPRNIPSEARKLSNVAIYDIDDLNHVLQQNLPERQAERIRAESMLQEEVNGFRSKLMAEHIQPTIIALRHHLEEICGQELRSLEDQYGPFTEDQQSTLHSLASHITQRIASTMARELKGLPEKADQQLLTEAVQRLFHLQPAKASVPALKN